MPFEQPSYNSVRVQRASRINSIEYSRLKNKILLLEKETVHKTRLTNQEVRMINLTLEYIQASSGKSPEGLPPEWEEVDTEEEVQPCFLYGDRLASRRFGRHRKKVTGSHSNLTSNVSRLPSTDSLNSSSSASSLASKINRPQSARLPQRQTSQVLVPPRPSSSASLRTEDRMGKESDTESDTSSLRSQRPFSAPAMSRGNILNNTGRGFSKIHAGKGGPPKKSGPKTRATSISSTRSKLSAKERLGITSDTLGFGKRDYTPSTENSRTADIVKAFCNTAGFLEPLKKPDVEEIDAWSTSVVLGQASTRQKVLRRKEQQKERQKDVDKKVQNFLSSNPVSRTTSPQPTLCS